MTTTESPQTITAGVGQFGDDPIRLGVPQRTFGELLKLAFPTVEHYHSDFYHDAQWLEKHLTGEMTFFFGFDEYGTAIGCDPYYVQVSRQTVYIIRIAKNKRKAWTMTASVAPHVEKPVR